MCLFYVSYCAGVYPDKEGWFKTLRIEAFQSYDDTYLMLNRLVTAQVSDTTGVQNSNAAKYIIIQLNFKELIELIKLAQII